MKKITFLFSSLAIATTGFTQATVNVIGSSGTPLSGTANSLTRMYTNGSSSTYVDVGPVSVTGGAYFRVSNAFGTLDIGPQSSANWCPFATSKDYFYFNKPLTAATGAFGSYNTTDFKLYTGMQSSYAGDLRMTILNSNGNVGIGLSSPSERLDVSGNVRINDYKLYLRGSADTYNGLGYNALSYSVSGPVLFGLNGGLLAANNSGTYVPALRWDNSGDVTIGSSTAATGSRLTVTGSSSSTDNMINVLDNTGATNFRVKANGFVYARDITVQVATFPDYVFDSTYNLMPLHTLDSYVNTNHHLPGVPTAATMQQGGMSLGEMNVILMQKVEELTLYMIEMQKQIDAMKQDQK